MATAHAADPQSAFDKATGILEQSIATGQIRAAALCARVGDQRIERAFGTARLDSFIPARVNLQPIAIAAVMKLYEEQAFSLDDSRGEVLARVQR